MPLVLRLDFEPTITLAGLAVGLETLALAGSLFAVLVLAAIGAGRLQQDGEAPVRLRRDDLLIVALGVLPGAVVGGRLDYALIHLDYYRANPAALTDLSQGAMGLTLALVLGSLSGLAVARLLGAPIGQWLHVASVPLLVGLGLGKLAMALGGAGQGAYSDASWATAYVAPGSWQSANPHDPAIPSQLIEGALLLVIAALFVAGPPLLRFRLRHWGPIVRPGRAAARRWWLLRGTPRFLSALGAWAVVRVGVAFSWRDAAVLGPLGAEQLLALGLLAACAGTAAGLRLREAVRRRSGRAVATGASASKSAAA